MYDQLYHLSIATWWGAATTILEWVLIQQKRMIRCNYQDCCRESLKCLQILCYLTLHTRNHLTHSQNQTAKTTRHKSLQYKIYLQLYSSSLSSEPIWKETFIQRSFLLHPPAGIAKTTTTPSTQETTHTLAAWKSILQLAEFLRKLTG